MRILIIHVLYVQSGGEDAVVVQEAKLLAQSNEVDVLYFYNKAGWQGALQFFCSIYNFAACRKIQKKVQSFQPDVVHLHNWHFASGPAIIRTIKDTGIPVVCTLHNYRLLCPSAVLLHNNHLFMDSIDVDFPWHAIKRKVYRNSMLQTFWLAWVVWFHKRIGTWRMIDGFICLTDVSKRIFIQNKLGIPANKFFVKPNFTNGMEVVNEQINQGTFLFIGRLSEEKGIRILLKAFEHSPYHLQIIGDGPLREMVEKYTEDFHNIEYSGSKNHSEIVCALRKCEALIFPSIWLETFGMVMIEAYANKTAVIGSKIGSVESLVEDGFNGLHFEPNHSLALHQALQRWMMFSEDKKDLMRKNAFESWRTKYSPASQINYFYNIYNSVISR